MTRLIGLSALLVLGAALVVPSVGAEDKEKKEDKVPSISEIMTAAHKGADSQLSKVRTELKEEKVDFSDVHTAAKKLTKLGTDLSKNKPPRGSEKSWKALTSTYLKGTKALEKAETKAAATKAVGVIGGTCKKCHDAHKEKVE